MTSRFAAVVVGLEPAGLIWDDLDSLRLDQAELGKTGLSWTELGRTELPFRCASAGIHSDSPASDRRSRVRAAPRARADDPGPRGRDTRPCMRAPIQALPGRFLGVASGAAGARPSHARALPRRRPWADSGTGALRRLAQTRFGSSSPAPPRLSPPPPPWRRACPARRSTPESPRARRACILPS